VSLTKNYDPPDFDLLKNWIFSVTDLCVAFDRISMETGHFIELGLSHIIPFSERKGSTEFKNG
jgi:hypothetical protein